MDAFRVYQEVALGNDRSYSIPNGTLDMPSLAAAAADSANSVHSEEEEEQLPGNSDSGSPADPAPRVCNVVDFGPRIGFLRVRVHMHSPVDAHANAQSCSAHLAAHTALPTAAGGGRGKHRVTATARLYTPVGCYSLQCSALQGCLPLLLFLPPMPLLSASPL